MEDGEAAPATAKKSDLGVRTLSAIVMLVGAGVALWTGGWLWVSLVGLLGLGVYWEWTRLVSAFAKSSVSKLAWLLLGIVYIGFSTAILAVARSTPIGFGTVLLFVLAVIATDVGAYFAGRTIGGPKIAPSISPSKTWAGLMGGMAASMIVFALYTGFAEWYSGDPEYFGRSILEWLVVGALVAIFAQAGDFFESWMKRRAGVKDSSNLIPGHGGLFDRFDGLLAVSFVGAVSVAVALGERWVGAG